MKKEEGKKTLCAPSYLNSIISYALNNYKSNSAGGQQQPEDTGNGKKADAATIGKELDKNKKDLGTNHAVKIELKITVAEDSPLFEEKIVFTDGSEKLLDCWEIFDLAKTIMDDKERTWKEMTVIIEDGKQLTINLL
jgi:hypothetical protein